MSDAAAVARPLPRIPPPFLAAFVLMTGLFVVAGILRSNRSTLRGDEIFTLFTNRENQTPMEMLQRGAQPQVSPAPLYYLVGRSFDESRARLNYLGLNYPGYFRLPSLLFTAGFGVAAALLLASRLRRQETPPAPIAWFLILCGLAVFWAHPKVFSFACTDRPYGLWNGLWFLSLAWLLCRPASRIGLAVLLSIMASTATAACFQILAIGVAFSAVRRLEGRTLREILLEGLAIFSAPALIGVYYAVQSRHFDWDGVLENDFNLMRFWLLTNLPAWLAVGAAGALIWKRPTLRSFATPVAAFAVLLLIIPLIYALARSRGYTSPSRQYIWTTTAVPLALFVAALGWSELKAWRPATALAVVLGTGLAAGYTVATFLRAPARNDSRILTCLDADSPLTSLLQRERPRSFYYLPSLGNIEVQNVALLAEWLQGRYGHLPIGTRVAILSDADRRLTCEVVDQPPGKWPEWIDLTIQR